jgi:phospholipid transport system transporter-binding protein
MSVTLERVNEQTWRVKGLMYIGTIQQLDALAKKMFEDSAASITVDLAEVIRSDSTAVALLIDWLRTARKMKKNIRFENYPQQMMDNIRVSGLESVIY